MASSSGSGDKATRLWSSLGVCRSPPRRRATQAACLASVPHPTAAALPRVLRLGQAGQGMESGKLAAADPSHRPHGHLGAVTVSPGGSPCASGGQDGQAMPWGLHEAGASAHLMVGTAPAPCASAPVAPASVLPLAQHQGLGLGGKILVDELKREVVVPAAGRSLPVHLAAGSADGQTLCRLHRRPSAGAAGDRRHPLEIIWQSSRSKKLVF